MLSITSISGNVFRDGRYAGLAEVELLRVSRAELGKSRIRRSTDGGTDVGLSLPSGESLRHGDVLLPPREGRRAIVVEQVPERVVVVRPEGGSDSAILVAHALGNMHRPISTRNGTICFPVQADSELAVFREILAHTGPGVSLSVEEMIFVPSSGGAAAHAHS